MEEDLDQALQVDVLAATLRSEHKQSADLLEFLAKMLESALPDSVTITRDGWFMSKSRPVKDLTVKFDEYQYQLVRERHGSFSARSMKLVRGVVLKTTEIPVDQCIDEIVGELVKLTEKNAAARRALNRFVLG